MSSLMEKSVIEQSELVQTRKVSALDLVEEAINQIERMNPQINAVVIPMFESALENAKKINTNSPFSGVPILLKDVLAEYKDWPLTEGSRFLEGYRSDRTSELVSRYLTAGFIPIGRTNSPEFASMPTTEPTLYGPTNNPWNRAYSPGGSSGGSAAAVACGMVSVAHANDGGGSIRIPAASCGLVGLKPTRGRNPVGPHYGDIGAAGILCEHVVTRTVLDNAALLDVSAGPDLGCPYSPMQHESYSKFVLEQTKEKFKIAFSTETLYPTDVDIACKKAVSDAAALCESLGHDVVEASPKVDASNFTRFFTTIWISMVGWMIKDWSKKTGRKPSPELFEPHTWKMFEAQARLDPSDFLVAVDQMHAFAREIAPFFEDYHVLLTPTSTRPPCPLGYFDFNPDYPREATERMENIPRFTAIANVTGQPAISLPTYWTNEGLPIGIQLLGRYGDEPTLFKLASQMERAKPWVTHYENLFLKYRS